MKWVDTTSYSQRETDRTPREWTNAKNQALVLVRKHLQAALDSLPVQK